MVTSRYFLQPVEELAKKHSVRAVAVDLNDRQELAMLKELRPGSCVGLVSISPGILRAAEVILHSMRDNELLLMTATPDVGSRLLALLRASSRVRSTEPAPGGAEPAPEPITAHAHAPGALRRELPQHRYDRSAPRSWLQTPAAAS